MRLWSIHPKYLDRQGLLGVWREGLLAQKVLVGETKAYKNHPQLERFKKSRYPHLEVATYLWGIWNEANRREYNFDDEKILGYTYNYQKYKSPILTITKGQLEYEFNHLQRKLHKRNYEKYKENNFIIRNIHEYEPHPLFKVIEGDIEKWEKIK